MSGCDTPILISRTDENHVKSHSADLAPDTDCLQIRVTEVFGEIIATGINMLPSFVSSVPALEWEPNQ
jgi:hypothetical protein